MSINGLFARFDIFDVFYSKSHSANENFPLNGKSHFLVSQEKTSDMPILSLSLNQS